MKTAAVGFRVHSGWIALVAVALEKGKPLVLARQRPHLVETFSYTFRQPYHTAQTMSLDEAEAFLARQRVESRQLATEALKAVQVDVGQQGYQVRKASLLTASGRPLPELAKILSAHSLIHTADGEFFRDALFHACTNCRMGVSKIKERDLVAAASLRLRLGSATLGRFLSKLGKPLGAPWSQDEKFAALAAWIALRTEKNS